MKKKTRNSNNNRHINTLKTESPSTSIVNFKQTQKERTNCALLAISLGNQPRTFTIRHIPNKSHVHPNINYMFLERELRITTKLSKRQDYYSTYMHVFSFNKEMFPQLLHSYHKSLRYFVLPKFILTLLFCTLYLRKDQFNINSLVLHREHLL